MHCAYTLFLTITVPLLFHYDWVLFQTTNVLLLLIWPKLSSRLFMTHCFCTVPVNCYAGYACSNALAQRLLYAIPGYMYLFHGFCTSSLIQAKPVPLLWHCLCSVPGSARSACSFHVLCARLCLFHYRLTCPCSVPGSTCSTALALRLYSVPDRACSIANALFYALF